MEIAGQWFGAYQGTNSGHVTMNLDRRPGGFSGSAAIIDADAGLPSATYNVTLRQAGMTNKITGHADLRGYFRIQFGKWSPIPIEKVRENFPELREEATHIEFDGEYKPESESLTLRYKTTAATDGVASLVKGPAVGERSRVTATEISWKALKPKLAELASGGQIFRGQAEDWPLQTGFHRSGRRDLSRFAIEDMERLRNAITSVTNTFLDKGDSEIIGTMLGIAQHHGFPTPLMDWSESPYVAAYFSVRDSVGLNTASSTIYAFDRVAWLQNNPVASDISEPLPTLAFLRPTAWRNPRLLPQQSILVYCNVENFEHFVSTKGITVGHQYLSAFKLIDSPAEVLIDLRMMGVHAPSLFPGLDGACRGAYESSIEI